MPETSTRQCKQQISIEQWFLKPAGRRVLTAERDLINQALTDEIEHFLPQWNILQLSVTPDIPLLQPIGQWQYYRFHPFTTNTGPDTICHFDQLPLATESIDVAILHHVQELVASPHTLLREIQRIVIPHGRLIIIGFNPWSLFGLCHQFFASHFRNNIIECLHFISRRRLIDWLSLLGFRINTLHYGFCRLSIKSGPPQNLIRKHWQALQQFRCCYVITAIKNVAALTPSKPHWSISAEPLSHAPTAKAPLSNKS